MFQKTTCLALCSFVACSSACQAQTFRIVGSGGYGLASTYTKSFSTRSLVTFSGRITGMTTAPPMAGTGDSTHIIVRASNGGSMLVELGPAWYVSHQTTKLRVRDRVTVVGSKVILDGRGSVMAQQVIKGNGALVLRNSSGQPYWSPIEVVVQTTAGVAAQPIVSNPAPEPPARIATTGQQGPVLSIPERLSGIIREFNMQGEDVLMTMDVGMSGVRTVNLGPLWFIERQDIFLEPGQLVQVSALTPVSSANALGVGYAQQVSSGGYTLTLRNQTGLGVWYPTYLQYPVWQTLPNGIAQPRGPRR